MSATGTAEQIRKMRNLDLETREIESKMAQFRQKQSTDNIFSKQEASLTNNGHSNSNNSFINNLNLKMLSITSANKVNP